jgi:predicted permease
MWQDIRLAIRGFRKSPSFTVTAMATLALAIGANTAIFNLLNALVLRDAKVRDPQSLVHVSTVNAQTGLESGLTYAMYRALIERQQVFSAVIGWRANTVYNLDIAGQRTRGLIAAVSGNYFDELGARPAIGRLLTSTDVNEPSEAPATVAVLGHAFWRHALASDPQIIGRTVTIESTEYVVIGVAPPDFIGLGMYIEPAVTVPLTSYPVFANVPNAALRTGTSTWVRVTGRLKSGTDLRPARAALATLWPALKSETVPQSLQGARRDAFLAMPISVTSAAKGMETGAGMRTRFTRPLYILLAIALLVLLIACLNLASVMVARSVAAAGDVGVRLALGAARARVMRAIVVEGVLLATAGAVAGTLVAMWASDALATLLFQDFTVRATLDVTPDARVLGFTALLTGLGGVLFSAVAAWRASRLEISSWLRQSGRTMSGRAHAGRWLVAAQVGLSLTLLVNAGLLVRSLQQVRAVPSGMEPRDVLVAFPQPRVGGYNSINNDSYYPQLVSRFEQLPGVQRVAIANFKPAGGGIGGGELVGKAGTASDSVVIQATFMSTSPQLFDVLGMRFVAGRDFSWTDHSQSRRVAIISAALARRLFAGEEPLGKTLRIGNHPRRQDIEVVGVVSDSHLYDLKDPNLAGVYVPSLQERELVDGKCFVIRGTDVSVDALDRVLDQFGYEGVRNAQSLEYIVDRVLLQDRLMAMFAGFFGAIAVLLAAVGLYGLMSFEVQQRLREIAIRVALGADRGNVVRRIVGDGVAITVVGLIVGIAAAFGSVQLVKSFVFGITPHDPATIVTAISVLAVIAVIACLLPAWRASKVDPTTILRNT